MLVISLGTVQVGDPVLSVAHIAHEYSRIHTACAYSQEHNSEALSEGSLNKPVSIL